MRRRPLLTLFVLLTACALSALWPWPAPAEAPQSRQGRQGEDSDSLVRLLSAQSAQLVEINGESVRKVFGPARFLHNNTYLICDTALWNVNTRIIDAIGHVKLLQ